MDNEPKKDSLLSRVGQSFKQGAKPKFLGGKTEGGDAPAGLKAGASSAAAGLQSAENAATESGINKTDDGIAGTRSTEEQAGGFYSGRGKLLGNSKNNKKGIKGKLKKGGPIAGILFAVLGFGGLIGGSQMFQPFSMVAQFTETFNSMHTSANIRSSKFFKMQMDSGRVKNPIKGKLFRADTFRISKKQASKLAAQGIEYDGDYDGNGTRVLKYNDSSGKTRIVTADVETANKIGGDAVDFKTIYADDVDFFSRYNAGSRTWRGAIANWFGTTTENFFKNNKISRNRFGDFENKAAQAEAEGKTRTQVAQEIMEEGTDKIEDGGIKRLNGVEEDENGEPVMDDDRLKPVVDEAEGETNTRANFDVNGKLQKIKQKMQGGTNALCAVVDMIGAVTLLVTASEALQIISLTTGYFEAVDKTKAGLGNDTPINELSDALNEKKKNTNTVLKQVGPGEGTQISENGESVNVNIKTEDVSTEKTAMQSSGMAALFGGYKVDADDPSVQSFNVSNGFKRILGGIGASMTAFSTCSIAKIAAATASAVLDGAEIAACIATFWAGGGACWGLVADAAISAAISVGVGLVLSAVISAIVPWVSNMLTRDLISNLGGEDLGNALTSGGNMLLGNTHKANGGSLATMDEYKKFAINQQQVIAENAKYERSTLSPFDITSKYTFMGTLLTRLMSFASVDNITSVVSTTGSTIKLSLNNLLPTAMAYNVDETLPETIGDYERTCPYLASIGAIGDVYCNPYTITDTSTISDDPADVINKVNEISDKNFTDSDGDNVKIGGDSRLAKYILFCDNRTSSFGVVDQNIANEVQEWNVKTSNSTINTASNAAIGSAPILGDVVDIVNSKMAMNNIGYVSGESCVAGNSVNAPDSPSWDEAKYYQRFIEDQSLAESMGLIEKSAVTAFLEDYYEKNPLDNSYEGILARKSGLDKDTVVAVLDLVEYADYIANYNPSERYAFGESADEHEDNINLDNEYRLSSVPTLLNQIIYADVRNRNFVV